APEGYEDQSTGSFDCSTNEDYIGPRGQLLTVCCWLSIKECGLFFGTLMNTIIFPKTIHDQAGTLTIQQIQAIGDQFVTILLSTKHIGAIEKSFLGFQAMCEKLFQCKLNELHVLPSKWIQVKL